MRYCLHKHLLSHCGTKWQSAKQPYAAGENLRYIRYGYSATLDDKGVEGICTYDWDEELLRGNMFAGYFYSIIYDTRFYVQGVLSRVWDALLFSPLGAVMR